MITLAFLGGTGTVTGSKFLVTTERAKVLVDCGLFQGLADLKRRNWQAPPVAPGDLDAIVLTHAHLDHTGYLPRFTRTGFRGHAWCTPGTADLASLLLPDAGFLQEEEAAHANRKGWSRHKPAEPLFTLIDAQRALRHLRTLRFGAEREIAPGVTLLFQPAGHIIGSAIATLRVEDGDHTETLVFSGDLGRTGAPLLSDPTPIAHADYLIVESTYGDRNHPTEPATDALAEIVNASAARGGMLVIPAFAVGRTQDMLYVLRELEDQGRIPVLDIFVDSPMAIGATDVAIDHADEFDPETAALIEAGRRPLHPRRVHFTRTPEESRAINRIHGPGIIISASGMASGGRVKHHLRQRLGDPRHTICFVGFQAAGTKGRAIVDGARQVWLHGEQVDVRAHITRVEGFSAHADRRGLQEWLKAFASPPRKTFVVHGEPEAAESLAGWLREEQGWRAVVPALGETYALAHTGAYPVVHR